MNKNAVYIPSIDGKDIYLANHYFKPSTVGYEIRNKSGDINVKKFINTLDFSLDLMKLRQVYERVYRRKNFSLRLDNKEYTHRVISVTSHYSIKQYNRIRHNLYIANGWRYEDVADRLEDCILIVGDELIAIQTDTATQAAVAPSLLGKYFFWENGAYRAKANIKTVMSVAEIRDDLYRNGFLFDGIRYVRFKRSAGSSRVGKCLYIDQRLHAAMHKWEMCGIAVNEGDTVDLAALESYIALTASSIIDTISIRPENILVIDDYISKFEDDVIAVRGKDGHLESKQERVQIANAIWDGQSLMDKSLFGCYEQYGMLLLRNRFFKSCCFNASIQQFFNDHGITSIEQLNGFTLARSLSDVKLITTPSSIKYLKFGRLRDWLRRIEPIFGVVKHEKKTHYFSGRMVQTHYQLLNTLQFTQQETDAFLRPSLEYVRLLKINPAVMRYHLKMSEQSQLLDKPMLTKNDIVFRMLGMSDRFASTKLYADFRDTLIRSYLDNIRRGHVLVRGNYSTLLGNPFAMLLASIGKFDGTSDIGIGHVFSKRFAFGQRLLASRSPHVCPGNIYLPYNSYHPMIDRYLNLTEEIICLNAIGENTLQRLSGADYDSDTAMISDDTLLIRAAEKNYTRFLVPTALVESIKTRRSYTNSEKADLDVKTSVNKIGEIINLSQELNTLYWHRLNEGAAFDDIAQIYHDASTLDVMSGLEIDKAKKEFIVDNAAEYRRIKAKYLRKDERGRTIKPNFFATIARKKGYYDTKKKCYQFHETTMDYVQHTINRLRLKRISPAVLPFTSIVDPLTMDWRSADTRQVNRVIADMRRCASEIAALYANTELEDDARYEISATVRQSCWTRISNLKCNTSTMYALLRTLDRSDLSDIRSTVFKILFGSAHSVFYQLIKESAESVPMATECVCGELSLYGYMFSAHVSR